MDAAPTPPGYTSMVHQGPIKPVLLLYVPHEFFVFNLLIAMFMMLTFTWRWLPCAVIAHGLIAALWAYDPHLLLVIWRAIKMPRFLRVG